MIHSSISSLALMTMSHMAAVSPPGDFVEVGVYKGGSAAWLMPIAVGRRATLHLFDTFTGMPYSCEHDELCTGHFSETDYETIVKSFPKAKVYKGVFPETLPNDLFNIAFVHVDCDQYQSVKACIEHLKPRLVEGGLLYFDDYTFVKGAKMAVDELLSNVQVLGAHAVWGNYEM